MAESEARARYQVVYGWEREENQSGRSAGRVTGQIEILRPTGQAGWPDRLSRLKYRANFPFLQLKDIYKHQPKYTFIIY